MDGVSAMLGVASFSIQLCRNDPQSKKVAQRDPQGAGRIEKLVDTLDELETLLVAVDGIINKQKAMDGIVAAVGSLEKALKRCQNTISELDAAVRTLEEYFARHGRLRKACLDQDSGQEGKGRAAQEADRGGHEQTPHCN